MYGLVWGLSVTGCLLRAQRPPVSSRKEQRLVLGARKTHRNLGHLPFRLISSLGWLCMEPLSLPPLWPTGYCDLTAQNSHWGSFRATFSTSGYRAYQCVAVPPYSTAPGIFLGACPPTPPTSPGLRVSPTLSFLHLFPTPACALRLNKVEGLAANPSEHDPGARRTWGWAVPVTALAALTQTSGLWCTNPPFPEGSCDMGRQPGPVAMALRGCHAWPELRIL